MGIYRQKALILSWLSQNAFLVTEIESNYLNFFTSPGSTQHLNVTSDYVFIEYIYFAQEQQAG
jgi:hypothetical protein